MKTIILLYSIIKWFINHNDGVVVGVGDVVGDVVGVELASGLGEFLPGRLTTTRSGKETVFPRSSLK